MSKTYQAKVKPYISEIETMASKGLTHEQIAKQLNISKRSLSRYLADNEELRQAFGIGRELAVNNVENAMYESAIGYTKKVTKGMKVKETIYENGKKVSENEKVEPYEEEIYIKPDTAAAIFLLKNWAKERYQNDPCLYDLKVREVELKEKAADYYEDSSDDPFC